MISLGWCHYFYLINYGNSLYSHPNGHVGVSNGSSPGVVCQTGFIDAMDGSKFSVLHVEGGWTVRVFLSHWLYSC